MTPADEPVEIEVVFDEGLLARMDRLRLSPGYTDRSEIVADAIEAAGE